MPEAAAAERIPRSVECKTAERPIATPTGASIVAAVDLAAAEVDLVAGVDVEEAAVLVVVADGTAVGGDADDEENYRE